MNVPTSFTEIPKLEKDPENGGFKAHRILDPLSEDKSKLALVVMILNEIRGSRSQIKEDPIHAPRDIISRLQSYTDILDLPSFIQNRDHPQASVASQDGLPEE